MPISAPSSHAKPFSVERVVALRPWTPSLISFTTTRPLELDYVPGQYARLGVQANGQLIWRAFSFVSSPDERLLEFIAVLIPDGLFTSALRELQAGDQICVEHENYGFMTVDRFVHGVRHGAELVYRDELLRMQSLHTPGSLLLPFCLSRPGPHEVTGRMIEGRLTTAWDSGVLETTAGVPVTADKSRVMLCGNPQMIEDMRARLHARGMTPCRRVAPGQFLTENYW